jgi:three-Cys-motif partner protein
VSRTVDHKFGNVSTDLKLSLVEDYLCAFTKALRDQFDELWYIDAFAGTGDRAVEHDARGADMIGPERAAHIERRRGSASIALQVTPAFDRLVFMDKKRSHCLALAELQKAHSGRNIQIVRADANFAIQQELATRSSWAGVRAVMFLDPYGLAVDWATLERIRATEAIDVWYLVSLSGLFRQAAHDPTAVTEKKRAAITRMLGTADWETEWYRREEKPDLFGGLDAIHQRTADVNAIEVFVLKRLQSLFPKVLGPKRLYSDRKVPQFALFLAISNPAPKAIGLATRIGNHILKPTRI